MIEITYADMFLFVVIVFMGWLLLKARVELHLTRRATMEGLYALYEGEAEIIVDEKEGSIRLQSKEKGNV
jgi:oxalate decarboxylase/phosphoglucose isomerase-like protein (cupin superfamily)